MNKLALLLAAGWCMAAPVASLASGPGATPADPLAPSLPDTIAALDAAVFDAFNRCSDPEQMQRHAGYFAPDVEFYHDTGGLTRSRHAMLVNTGRHACGKYRRELVPGTLQVFPIQGYGAIAQGSHRFCPTSGGRCEGEADFVIVWQQRTGRWTITRVLSYGHRPRR